MEYQATSRRQFVALTAIGAVGLSGCLDDDEPAEAEPEEEPEEEPEAEYDIDDQPEDAAVSFVAPEDGSTVSSPVLFEADVEGIELAPAGDAVVGEGHLHLVVNGGPFEETEPYETGDVIPGPADEIEDERGIFHWSDGQSEGEIDLEPGEYTVTIQIADGPHRAFGENDEISITVENGNGENGDEE